jgi:phosphate starvation-inducible protein PhoH
MRDYNRRLNKKQKRELRRNYDQSETINNNFKNLSLKQIKPLTETQIDAFEAYEEGLNLILHGFAGTGKTFLALYFALKTILDNQSYNKIVIIRSTVSSRNQGFLPGNQKQKEAVYEKPYPPICSDLFGRDDAYEILKRNHKIEFESTSFLRGITYENSVVIVDEFQNMSDIELHTIMTRIGENCRIIFSGDIRQDDLTSERFNEKSGIADFLKIIKHLKEFEFIEFFEDDIVRSELIKSYIIERAKLGL